LSSFCEWRKANFNKHKAILSKYPQYFILPEATENSAPAWFSFIVTLKDGTPFTRDELTAYLNNRLIETRNLFAGNITKQPAFINKNFRIADSLNNTEKIMTDTFFLGTYPGLTDEMFAYIESIFEEFISK
jgi:CDP-6-deoxy-D-xylo-4-hexulose-3-dehydrase